MSIKDDMPFLASIYEKATEEQKEEIRKVLGISKEKQICGRCGQDKHALATDCRYYGSGVGGMDI